MEDLEDEIVIIVGTHNPRRRNLEEPAVEDSLAELSQLVSTVGGKVVESVRCRLDRINPRTYINKGKAEEIATLVSLHQATLVVFDDELSPGQNRNLEKVLGTRSIDRRAVIIDIFAQRAQTKEGKLQVELARLIYLMPRLTRMWTHLERQKGGIGLRGGPGEKQIELDRRIIRDRMAKLKKDLAKVRKTREIQREARKKVPVPQVVLVGYTNSGKSTLFNRLTESHVEAEDKLFATLDPTTRRLQLDEGQVVTLTDSVGFIRKLPPELVEAFKATLEEVQRADLLLHVIDCSDPLWESHKRATEVILKDLDCLGKPLLEIYNKIDRHPDGFALAGGGSRVFISALRGDSTEELLERISERLSGGRQRVRLILPQARGDLLAQVHREGKIFEEKYTDEHIELTVELSTKRIEKWKKFGFVVQDYSPVSL